MKEFNFFEFIFEYIESVIASIELESFLQAFVIYEIAIVVSEVIAAMLVLRERVNVKVLTTIDVIASIVGFVLWKNFMVGQVGQVAYYCGCGFGVLTILGAVFNIVLWLLDSDSYGV